MQQSCTYGSVRGASGNRRPYRDKSPPDPRRHLARARKLLKVRSASNVKIGISGSEKDFSAACLSLWTSIYR
jgi:hypothetical protein